MDMCMQMNNMSLTEFNSEVIWDSNKDLFEIYFKTEFIENKCKHVNIDMEKNILPFDKALSFLSIQ